VALVKPIATVSDLPQPGRTLVMGVVNVTPDSFSDGGEWFDAADAIAHGRALIADGADIIDVGGESTRPGARRVGVEEELRRVLPVVSELAGAGATVSVDTMDPRVVREAHAAGARLVNDVSGGRAHPEMLATVAALDVPYICMHWRGHSADMQSRAVYDDVVAEVVAELGEQIEAAVLAGIRTEHLVLDPGFGFAKNGEHNWEILRRLDELDVLGLPVLIGVSRKGFLGKLLPDSDGRPRPPVERDDATLALTTLVAGAGAWGVRVHRVRPSRDAIAVVQRLDT
jgi:dihydropteroate synthase